MTIATPRSPVSADEVAATRQPVDRARLLPPHVFHDSAVFDFEQRAWFGRDWLCVGRVEDVAEPGSYRLVGLPSESAIVIRARDGELRALSNVCRHRGSTIIDEPTGRAVRLQCPYHAWVYDLDGALLRAPHTDGIFDFDAAEFSLHRLRIESWQGFIFISFDPTAGPLADQLADLPEHVANHRPAELRRARRIEYDVRANWKVIAENYSECYHCPGVHPQLNRLTPYDRGHNFASHGSWAGGWMELVDEADTMSTDGHTHGRRPLPGLNDADARRIYYFVVWPNLLLSLHPDYVMTHQVWPLDAERSRVVCEWLFDPTEMAGPGFDPTDAVDFWDQTNRQDWAVCERQQQGTRSASYTAGRYSLMEDMVHAFDLMVADRYAEDGVVTRFEPRHDKWSDRARRTGGRRASASR